MALKRDFGSSLLTLDGFTLAVDCSPSVEQPSDDVVRYGCFSEIDFQVYSPTYALKFPEERRERRTSFAVEKVEISKDGRLLDGYRENASTAVRYECTSIFPQE